MNQELCISADSHVVEAPEVFAGLARQYGEDQAPRIVYHPEYGDTLVIPGQPIRPNFGVGRYGIAGLYANDPETIRRIHPPTRALRKRERHRPRPRSRDQRNLKSQI